LNLAWSDRASTGPLAEADLIWPIPILCAITLTLALAGRGPGMGWLSRPSQL